MNVPLETITFLSGSIPRDNHLFCVANIAQCGTGGYAGCSSGWSFEDIGTVFRIGM